MDSSVWQPRTFESQLRLAIIAGDISTEPHLTRWKNILLHYTSLYLMWREDSTSVAELLAEIERLEEKLSKQKGDPGDGTGETHTAVDG